MGEEGYQALEIVQADPERNLLVVSGSVPGANGGLVMIRKGQEQIAKEFVAKTGEPWITQDSLSTYGDMWIFKDAMEKAGSADPKKVAAAIRSLDESDGAARYFPGGRLKFEPNGRRAGAELVIVQWQSGEPKAIYPPSLAAAKPMWPKR